MAPIVLTPEQSAAASILSDNQNPLKGIVPDILQPPATPPYNGPLNPNPPAPAPINAGQQAMSPSQAAAGPLPLPNYGVSNTIAQQLFSQADKFTKEHPQAASAPGGWARAVLAGAQGALAGLGDIPTDRALPGSGPLGAISKTLNNRTNRIDKQNEIANQQKQQAFNNQLALNRDARETERDHTLNALNAADLYNQQVVAHSNTEKERQANIATGRKDYEAFTSGDVPAVDVHLGVSAAEKAKLMQEGKLNGHAYTSFPVDQREVGEDPVTHQPNYETLYNVTELPKTFTFDEKTAARIAKFVPSQPVPPGTQMSGPEARSLTQRAANNETAALALEANRRKNNLEELDLENKESHAEQIKAINAAQPQLNEALGKSKGNVINALPAFLKAGGNYSDFMGALGGGDVQKGQADYRAEYKDRQEIALKWADKNEKDGMDAGYIMTDAMKAKIAAMPQDKQNALNNAPESARPTIMSVAFGPGDAKFRDIFVRTAKGQKILSPSEAYGIIKQLNPNWDEKQYDRMGKEMDRIMNGPESVEINNYQNVLKHAAHAKEIIDKIRGAGGGGLLSPAFANTALNKLQDTTWGDDARAIETALEPVHEEFQSLMLAGHAPHDETLKAYNQIFDPGSTPNQIDKAFQIIGSTGAYRLETKNSRFKSLSGQNIPGLLDEDALKAAKQLNLDPEAMRIINGFDVGGTLFHSPEWKPPSKAEVEKQLNEQQGQKEAAQVVEKDVASKLNASQYLPANNGKPAIFKVNGQWVTADGKSVQ